MNLSDILYLLSNADRRALLAAFADDVRTNGTDVDLEAATVAADLSASMVHHAHLPALEDAGVIGRGDGGRLTTGPHFGAVEAVLRSIGRHEEPTRQVNR